MNSTSTVTFTYHDPNRTFKGTPYEAAGQAVTQSSNVLKLFLRSISDTDTQVRNAYMQRSLDLHGEPDAAGYEDSGEAKMLASFVETTKGMQKRLTALHRAASYDPSAPMPKA